MQNRIKKLKKELKKSKALNQKLDNEIVEYHHDIIILDQTNFLVEKENTQLQNKIVEYEEVYLKDAKSQFEKRLHTIMIEVQNVKSDDSQFYNNTLQYMSEYIKAIEQYAQGDTKKIIKIIKNYKIKVYESQKALQKIKHEKKTLFKKIDRVSSTMKVFKMKLANTI